MLSLVNEILGEPDSNFIGAFLYGSQNYNLAIGQSDRDIIILVKDNTNLPNQFKKSWGVAKIYNLQKFLSRLTNGDMECYEILYTNYRFINPIYEKYFDEFVIDFDKVVNINRIKLALRRKLREHLIGITWIPVKYNGEKYNKKRVYWSCRVYDQLTRISLGESLKDTFIYNEAKRDELIQIKQFDNILSLSALNEKMIEMVAVLKTPFKEDTSLNELEI